MRVLGSVLSHGILIHGVEDANACPNTWNWLCPYDLKKTEEKD